MPDDPAFSKLEEHAFKRMDDAYRAAMVWAPPSIREFIEASRNCLMLLKEKR